MGATGERGSRDLVSLSLERPGGRDDEVRSALGKMHWQLRILRIHSLPGGADARGELRGGFPVPPGHDHLETRVASQHRGDHRAEITVAAEDHYFHRR